MKKKLFKIKKIFILAFLLLFLFSVDGYCETETALFLMKDETVLYSPEGYFPKAECSIEEITPFISYFAINTETSIPVSVPLTSPGTYQVFAIFEGNEKYEKYETSSTITISPVEAKIVTPYKTVAYSKMENQIPYSVEPVWAKEYLEISVEYYPIESLDSYPKEKITVPTDLGLYYTVFCVNSKNDGIICGNKYMIYEIAAYRGKKLSQNEQRLSVPTSFKCVFQNLSVIYEKGASYSPSFTLSPAAISGKIMYKQLFTDGTFSPYFENAPTEPGEYICGYFLENQCIGEGNIFIDKKEVAITMENLTAEYTPLGIIPKAFCESSEIEIAYTAFVMDKEGAVTTEETPIPLKQWGKYSVIAYPKDTEHYKRTYAYATIEITPSTPEINVTQTEFIYDGTKKEVGFEVSPKDVLYSTEYYEWEERESKIPIGSAPSRAGKYMVVITAYDKNGNYNTVSKTAIMYIDNVTEENKLSKKEILFLTITGAVLAGVVTAIVVLFTKKRKKF